MLIGWGSRHIKKAFIDALFWRVETSQLSDCVQDLATVDVLRDIDYPSCAYLVHSLRICVCAHAYLNYVAREYIYIRRGLRVVGSNVSGNAKASKGGTGKCKFHAFFVMSFRIDMYPKIG